ncbi:MAG: hypothetical protein NT096_06310 [Proteobacteria bacterium]|nr:hypothetical protein [Pseudomonadota bacterium]
MEKEIVAISLDQKEQMELEVILTDQDGKAALQFLKDIIRKKIKDAQAGPICGPSR